MTDPELEAMFFEKEDKSTEDDPKRDKTDESSGFEELPDETETDPPLNPDPARTIIAPLWVPSFIFDELPVSKVMLPETPEEIISPVVSPIEPLSTPEFELRDFIEIVPDEP